MGLIRKQEEIQSSGGQASSRKMLHAPGCGLFAGGEPHSRQTLHAADQLIEHFDSQRPARHIGVEANIQIASLVVLLKECGPPHLEYTIGIAHTLRRAVAAKPAKGVELSIVNRIMKRKIEERIFSCLVRDVVGQMTRRIIALVKNTRLLQQAVRVAASRTGNGLATNCSECSQRFLEMVSFESGLARNPMLPHMISKFMIAGDSLSERSRIKLANPARSEDGSLDGVRVEKFD